MRCVPNRTQLQLIFLHSLKQTWESVKGSSVFNGRLHHHEPSHLLCGFAASAT